MTSVAFHNQGWRLTPARHGVREDGKRKRWWKRKRRHCCRSSSLGAVKGQALAAAATLSGCHVTSSSQGQLARAHSLHSSWTDSVRKSLLYPSAQAPLLARGGAKLFPGLTDPVPVPGARERARANSLGSSRSSGGVRARCIARGHKSPELCGNARSSPPFRHWPSPEGDVL